MVWSIWFGSLSGREASAAAKSFIDVLNWEQNDL